IAIVAAPIGRHFLAEVLEDVTRAALRRLAELNHRAELLLIHRAPLLVVLQISAQIHRAEIAAEALPLSAAVLANQSVTLEQRENDLCLSGRNPGELDDVVEQHRCFEWIFLQRERDLRRFLHLRVFAAEEVRLDSLVLDAVEHLTHRWLAVAPRPAGFLIVCLDRTWKMVV